MVSIDRNGGYAVGARAVTFAQLESEFAAIAAMPDGDQPVVRIRADGGVSYQKVIDVLSVAKSKGLTKVGFDTETR